MAIGRVRARPEELERALTGKVTAHHRFLLGEHLRQMAYLEEAIHRVSDEMARRFSLPDPPPEAEAAEDQEQDLPTALALEEPNPPTGPTKLTWQEAVDLLDQITGISERAAQGMLAELGKDMSRFASAKHLASWAGVCPGTHESAGKRLSGKTWPRQSLVATALGSKCACGRT